MEPLRPELYLDPLLPLSVRRNPVVIPSVAGTAVRGLLVCSAGKYLVLHGGQTLSPPAPSLTRVDFAAGPALRRPGKSHGSGARTEGWLIVIGGRLLDQLIVGAVGDPGFSRFLDELDSPAPRHVTSLTANWTPTLQNSTRNSPIADRPTAFVPAPS